MKWNKSTATVFLVLACIGLVGVAKFYFFPHGFVGSKVGPRAQGNPNAEIKIVEFMDAQCGTCAEAAPILKNYLYTYPSKIYWEVKFYPLVKSHLYALKSAIYCECAARQNKFWPFFDAVLENQKEWSQSQDPDAIFMRFANDAKLDPGVLKACVADDDAKRVVHDEADEAVKAGVRATPTFFVNGKIAVGPKGLQEELDPKLR